MSYFDTLALRVICDSLWSSCFASYGPKDTPVKPVARGYKMLRDFAGLQEHGLADTSSQIFGLETIRKTLFLSLRGNKTQSQTLKTSEFSSTIVCYTALFSVVTQRSSREKRCVTTLKPAV